MIKTALIGLGRIGWSFHLPEILKHNEYCLCAVADIDRERLDEVRRQYGIAGYTDYREMLQKEAPELVVIASPTVFHTEQAIACLQAGSDVLLDKPMASDLASANEIAAAAKACRRKITVFQPHRFNPVATVAKRIIDSGILGEIFQIRRCNSDYVRRNDWQSVKKYGGGMLNNYGAHYIDQLLVLSGQNAEKLFCQTRCIATVGDADDVVKLVMQTEQGTILDIDINQAAALEPEPMTIYGKYGAAKLRVNAEGQDEFLAKYYDPSKMPECPLADTLSAKDRKYPAEQFPWQETVFPVLPEDQVDYYGKCAAYFSGREEAPVPLQETIRVMQIIDSCRKFAEQ